jgi:hypothetical protein
LDWGWIKVYFPLIALLGVKVIVKGMNLQIQVDVKTHRRKHEDNDAEI